jgi:hypothetical protein
MQERLYRRVMRNSILGCIDNNYRMVRLSYSMISAFNRYKEGKLCGLLFRAAYIDKSLQMPVDEELVNAGKWFEKQCTGYGEETMPVTIKGGELNAKYRYLQEQVERFKELQKTFPDNVAYGNTIEIDEPVPAKGIIDVIYPKVIRDIKTTSNINGRDDFGWGGKIEFKPALLQAKMYVWLLWKVTGGEIWTFYYDIYSNTKEKEVKCIEVKMSEESLIEFEKYLLETKEELDFFVQIGFDVHPCLDNCEDCPLADKCEFKSMLPKIEKIEL